jgi:hypothetical protein
MPNVRKVVGVFMNGNVRTMKEMTFQGSNPPSDSFFYLAYERGCTVINRKKDEQRAKQIEVAMLNMRLLLPGNAVPCFVI